MDAVRTMPYLLFILSASHMGLPTIIITRNVYSSHHMNIAQVYVTHHKGSPNLKFVEEHEQIICLK